MHNVLLGLYFAALSVLLLGGGGAHSASLPTTITAGSTTSVGDTVASGGTSLAVSSMLTNAAGSGSGMAEFHAEGLQFAGTLTINCPTTATSYALPYWSL